MHHNIIGLIVGVLFIFGVIVIEIKLYQRREKKEKEENEVKKGGE